MEIEETEFVVGLYQAALGRKPDADGFAHYTKLLREGVPAHHVVASILASKEFADLQRKKAQKGLALESPKFHSLRPNECPIAIVSFNRPHYLARTLSSLRNQLTPIEGRPVILFQDGSWSQSLNVHHCEPALCQACIQIFREQFPNSLIFDSDVNLGTNFNFERAEKYVFEEFGATAAIFLEDDLILGRNYIAIIEQLLELALSDERIGYVTAYGNWKASASEQRSNARKLRPMHLLWAFGLTQRHWRKCRPYVEPYLDLVRGSDYRERDHERIRSLVRTWGIDSDDTAQDRIKAFATALVGCVMLSTEVAYGRYIGEQGGLNFTPELYQKWRLDQTHYFDDILSLDFDLSSANFDPWHPDNNVKRFVPDESSKCV